MSRFFLLLLGAARIGACNASAGARRAQDDVAPPVDEADPPPVEQFEVDTREHISDFHDVPSSFTVPELTMSSIGYVALAELPDGAAIAVSHSFVGVTDVGLLGELQPLRADNAVERRRPRTYIRGLCNELLIITY